MNALRAAAPRTTNAPPQSGCRPTHRSKQLRRGPHLAGAKPLVALNAPHRQLTRTSPSVPARAVSAVQAAQGRVSGVVLALPSQGSSVQDRTHGSGDSRQAQLTGRGDAQPPAKAWNRLAQLARACDRAGAKRQRVLDARRAVAPQTPDNGVVLRRRAGQGMEGRRCREPAQQGRLPTLRNNRQEAGCKTSTPAPSPLPACSPAPAPASRPPSPAGHWRGTTRCALA